MTQGPPALTLPADWRLALRRGMGVVAEIKIAAAGFNAQGLAECSLPKSAHEGAFFFLESQGARERRISLVASQPLFSFLGKGSRGIWHAGGVAQDLRLPPERVFETLGRSFAKAGILENEPGMSPLLGWVAYDAGARYEPMALPAPDPLGLPEWFLMLPGEWAWFDPEKDLWRFRLLLADSAFYGNFDGALGLGGHASTVFPLIGAEEMVEAWRQKVIERADRARRVDPHPVPRMHPRELAVTDNADRQSYGAKVLRAKDYISAGDVFQVNLSHRRSTPYTGNAWRLFRRLGQIDPSPFAAFADLGAYQIVSASPERLFMQDGSHVETHPIAGTVALDEEADILRNSGKDRAEHIMTVDIERNDLGRVCMPGSVRVDKLMELQSASHVRHLVSRIEGTLKEGRDLADLFRAAFPGGSITGAPKIRCMQLIAELEQERRGLYTGGFGFWDPVHEQASFSILIRSILLCRGKAWWQIGGGVVADSNPDSEWEETLHKGRSLQLALETAPE